MHTITNIPVMDSDGAVIGQAILAFVSDGAEIHVVVFDGTGMDLARAISEGWTDGLVLKPGLPPVRQATRGN